MCPLVIDLVVPLEFVRLSIIGSFGTLYIHTQNVSVTW
jgi:hypothetical protein